MGTIEANVDKVVSKMEGQLAQWAATLDDLVSSADQAGDQARREARARLDEVKSKLAAAHARLDEVRAAGADKWETMKQGLEQSWQDLERTFQRLTH